MKGENKISSFFLGLVIQTSLPPSAMSSELMNRRYDFHRLTRRQQHSAPSHNRLGINAQDGISIAPYSPSSLQRPKTQRIPERRFMLRPAMLAYAIASTYRGINCAAMEDVTLS